MGLFLTGCSSEKDISILLITLDTFQMKSLGVYGNKLNLCPNIDQIAKNGFIFDNAFCVCNRTAPSHASILSSNYISEHGVINNYTTKVDPNVILLPEILKELGYSTFASVSTHILNPENCGLDRGFDHFSRHDDPDFKIWIERIGVRGLGVTNSFFGWFKKKRPQKFFVWLHYFDAHTEYFPPSSSNSLSDEETLNFWVENDKRKSWEEYDKNVLDTGRVLYNGETKYMDHEIGRLVNFLKEEEKYDDTLIIITNDHGENVEEHKPFFGHSTLFDEVIRSPLIFKLPDRRFLGCVKGRSKSLSSSIDIAPTILDYMGINIPESFSGNTLLPIMKDPESSIRDYLINEMTDNLGFGVIFSSGRFFSYLDIEQYKMDFKNTSLQPDTYLIQNYRPTDFRKEYYDITKDPVQKIDQAKSNPTKMKEAEKLLDDWRQKGIYHAYIDNPCYYGDFTGFHRNFFYVQMNFSNKKTARFKLGKELMDKDFVLNLAETGRVYGRKFDLKGEFVSSRTEKDKDFKRSKDYSLKIENIGNESMQLKSDVLPVNFEEIWHWSLSWDFYTYSVDLFIEDPGVTVKLYSFSWTDEFEGDWRENDPEIYSESTSKIGEWQHLEFVRQYGENCKSIGMMIEIDGKGTVWMDNPLIDKILNPFPVDPWNDPDLKEEITEDSDIALSAGDNREIILPFAIKFSEINSSNITGLEKINWILIHRDDTNLYITYDGKPDKTLYVELGGYIGNAEDNLKKADESKGLTKEDIDQLKALGYIN